MNFDAPAFFPPPPGLPDPMQASYLQAEADRNIADRVETLENVLRPYLPHQILEAGNEGGPQTVEVLAQLLGTPSAPTNPYTLGTTAAGSTDPEASADPPDPDAAMTDTADVASPPKDIDGVSTDGFKVKLLTRIYDVADVYSGTTERTTFSRHLVFRAGGLFVSATAETVEETITVSGSGSAGGTV
jgi:hypothetical protein